MLENLLLERATTLRKYLETPLAGKELGIFKRFPVGCCRCTSIFFLKWIGEKDGINDGVLVANAKRYDAKVSEGLDHQATHAWAEVRGFIVDITADQFDDFSNPIVVASSSDWHNSWTGMEQFSHDSCTSISDEHLREYENLSRHINKTEN